MSKTMDTSQWIQFFRRAGLPPNVAANYALIFSDNRIQTDMLLDLSKEYLYDMDIKVMGDVIAILKYAKEFHNQLAKEKIIGSSVIVPSKTAVAERMVGRYTRPVVPSPVRAPASQADRDFQKSTVISLKRKAPEKSGIRKIRRVPPEEEGGYKIKMPSGTTERTRKILQQQQQLQQGNKRSVFSRLGDSAVSSSTDSKVSSSVFERLGPSSKNICDDTPTSTVFSDIDRPSKKGAPLQYRGVLKMTVGKNRTVTTTSKKVGTGRTVIQPKGLQRSNVSNIIKLNQINSILQTNKSPRGLSRTVSNTRSQGIFGERAQKINVKSRLGGQIDAHNLTRTLIMQKKKVPVKSSSNVFERLGR